MATVTVRFDDDGYVDAGWALETAYAVLSAGDIAYTGADVDEMVDWLREGNFRDGETVEIATLVEQWREYNAVEA